MSMNGRWANEGIHHSAVIGHPPEHRDWMPGDPVHAPMVAKDAVINAFCTVDAGLHRPTRIGSGSWLLKRVHVGHDAWVGENCLLAVGCIIGGNAEIDDNAKIGLGAIVLPFKRVGRGAEVGAGAVVTRDVPAGEIWAGNPARKMEGEGRTYTQPFIGGVLHQ